jgi:hypothetical protein
MHLSRLIGELSKLLNEDKLVMSAKDTIIVYKIFSIFETLFEKSEKCLTYVFDNFNEEFR